MSFLAPAMLGFAAVLPLVVALYFLKLHRAPKVVSSTYLWKRTIDAYRVNRPFDRFQNRAILWVQLLVLALLVLALARPLLEASEGESDVHIWLVDRSASMSAREGRTTRLEIAKGMLRDAVRAKRRADRLMIIGFSDRAEVACALTQDEGALLRGVDALAPTRRPTRLGDAWATALSVARQVDRSDVYLLSDGRFPDLGRLTEANATVHYVPVGASDDNLGIVDVKVREAERGQAAREIFARVKSARPRPSTARVTLTLDGSLVDEQEVEVGPGESRGVVFRRAAGERGIAEVRIAGRDALPEDDAAAVSLEAPEPASVLLVGPDDDPFLREALARDPGVSLERVPAAGFDARAAERDLVVVQGALPASPAPLPRGTYLFLGALPPLDGFGPAASTATPVLEGWDKEHPLTRHLGFASLHPASLVTGPEPSWMKPLLWSDGGAVISAGEGLGYRLAVVRFPLLESDWPLRVSFPLFLANAVRWARDADAAERPRRPGEPLVVRVPPGAAAGTLVRPGGGEERIDPAGRRRVALSPIEETGVYRVRWDGRKGEAAFPVALADEDETDIRVARSIAMGPAEVRGAAPRAITRREAWRRLAAAALALVLLEWLLYARGRRAPGDAQEEPAPRAPSLAAAGSRGGRP